MRFMRQNSWFGVYVIALTCFVCVAWQLVTPMATDDYVYKRIALPSDDTEYYWQMTGEFVTSINQVPEAVVAHAKYVNGRLGNLVYTSLQLLPLWIINMLNGLAMCAFFVLLLRYIKRHSWCDDMLTALTAVMFWVFLQWNDQMCSAVFQFNYTWSSVLMLGTLIVFDRDRRPRLWCWVLLVVLGFWHEGFAIVTGVYLGVRWLFRRRDWWLLVAVCVLFVEVVLSLFTASGTRAGKEVRDIFNINLMIFAATGWPFVLSVIFWLTRRIRVVGDVRRNLDMTALAVVVACLASFAITHVTRANPRAHWPAELLVIVLAGRTLTTYRIVRFATWLRVALLCVYVAWGASLVYWQARVRIFSDEIDAQLVPGNAVVVSDNAVYAADMPFWLMGIVNEPVGPHRIDFMWTQAYHIVNREFISFCVVPSEYRNVPFEKWPEIPGNNNLRGFYGNYMRRADGTQMVGRKLRIHLHTDLLNTSPIKFVAGYLGRGMAVDGTVDVNIVFAGCFPYQGDSIQVLSFYLPETLKSRSIVAIDEI